MNIRLDVVVNDIVGMTGTKIITEFIAGERSGKKLAQHRHYNCRKSEEEITKALPYNGRNDYLFALKQEWNTYLHLQKQIQDVDAEIKKLMEDIINNDDNKKQHVATKKPHKRKNKNTIEGTDMNQVAYQYFEGIDLRWVLKIDSHQNFHNFLETMKNFETLSGFPLLVRPQCH